MGDTALITAKFQALCGRFDEATLRMWAAAEARSLGRGGVSAVAKAIGMSRTTIHSGLAELKAAAFAPETRSEARPRVRATGGGRKRLTAKDANLLKDLDALVEPTSRGDPMSPLRWTCKSTYRLAGELQRLGHEVSQRTVCDLLTQMDYSLQSTRKTREGGQHADRDAQFAHIARTVSEYQAVGDPVISVDTKKKELIGNVKNGGRVWGQSPTQVNTHDFLSEAVGRATPYGIYDLTHQQGSVFVGTSYDTPQFAAYAIAQWWADPNRQRFVHEDKLLILCDSGGSNHSRYWCWKIEVQKQ